MWSYTGLSLSVSCLQIRESVFHLNIYFLMSCVICDSMRGDVPGLNVCIQVGVYDNGEDRSDGGE